MFVLATGICVALFLLLILKLPGSQQDIITSFRAALFFVGLLALQNYVLPDSFALFRHQESRHCASPYTSHEEIPRLPATMKEALIDKDTKVSIIDSPVPKPGPGQILIRVVVSGSNPKDWKVPMWTNSNINQGDDIAGTVVSLGPDTHTSLRAGDRVAAFHTMITPHGSYAEYAIAPATTTFAIPESTSFEEAATIPLAALTSATSIFGDLRLPQPWAPAKEEIPLIIYGAASAVGSYAIQLAVRANIHPIIAIAGKSQAHVEGLIDKSKGDVVLDYREGDDKVVEGMKAALKGRKVRHALDAVIVGESFRNVCKVLEPQGSKLSVVLPGGKYEGVPEGVELIKTSVGTVHKDGGRELGYVACRYFELGLAEGWFKPHPHEVIRGGLGGVQEGLLRLKDGKANALKYVFRISETEGAGKEKL